MEGVKNTKDQLVIILNPSNDWFHELLGKLNIFPNSYQKYIYL